MKKKIYQFIFFKLMGWKLLGNFDTSIKKSVVIVIPHTSWHDFYIGVFTRGVLGININFVGKKELFIFPFGYYFRWMGGAALNRFKNENKVDAIAKIFEGRDEFRLAIAPEGTRKKVTELRTGFYYIAMKANVPIIPVAFDWTKKEVTIFPEFYPTGNKDADFTILEQNFVGIEGKVKEYGYNTEKK